eukprot:m.325780 g.325780  ORF g.325780 m.325780 type:complete len:135 (+) comp16472_c1_seq46:352-756(+)
MSPRDSLGSESPEWPSGQADADVAMPALRVLSEDCADSAQGAPTRQVTQQTVRVWWGLERGSHSSSTTSTCSTPCGSWSMQPPSRFSPLHPVTTCSLRTLIVSLLPALNAARPSFVGSGASRQEHLTHSTDAES